MSRKLSGTTYLSGCGPLLISEKTKVDPLRDRRVAKVLHKHGMEHCYVPSSFGQEGEEEHKLKSQRGIAANSSGQFIVGDINKVKMFYPTGHFIQHFSLPNDDVETNLFIRDVATDNKDNIYVLVECEKTGSKEFVVYKFNNTADLHHKFPVRGEDWVRLTVTNSKVLVLSVFSVDVYDTDGLFVRSFGKGVLKKACDITAANDGRVVVVDWNWDGSCVHIFTEDGHHLDKFKLQGGLHYDYPSIAFHMLNEHVVTDGYHKEKPVVKIFTKDGEFVRSTQIHEERVNFIKGITVARDGRIGVLLVYINDKCKVLVI